MITFQPLPQSGLPTAFYDGIYSGDVFRISGSSAMMALARMSADFVRTGTAPVFPPHIHRHIPPAELGALMQDIRHQYAKSAIIRDAWLELFASLGLDPAATARDRVMLRFQAPESSEAEHRSFQTIALHRDTWGTNIYCQVNWWAPLFPLAANRTMGFCQDHWRIPVQNDSAEFDLPTLLHRLRTEPDSVKADQFVPRTQDGIVQDNVTPLIIEPGEIVAFSAQHLHGGLMNTSDLTRISIETRTLDLTSYVSGVGAPNIDGRAMWEAPGFFSLLSDGDKLSRRLGIEATRHFVGPIADMQC